MTVPVMHAASLPSPRAQELGERLAEVVRDYQQRTPDLSATEIQQAMQVAWVRSLPSAPGSGLRVVLAGLVGALALLVSQIVVSRGNLDAPLTLLLAGLVLLMALAAFVVYLRSR